MRTETKSFLRKRLPTSSPSVVIEHRTVARTAPPVRPRLLGRLRLEPTSVSRICPSRLPTAPTIMPRAALNPATRIPATRIPATRTPATRTTPVDTPPTSPGTPVPPRPGPRATLSRMAGIAEQTHMHVPMTRRIMSKSLWPSFPTHRQKTPRTAVVTCATTSNDPCRVNVSRRDCCASPVNVEWSVPVRASTLTLIVS